MWSKRSLGILIFTLLAGAQGEDVRANTDSSHHNTKFKVTSTGADGNLLYQTRLASLRDRIRMDDDFLRDIWGEEKETFVVSERQSENSAASEASKQTKADDAESASGETNDSAPADTGDVKKEASPNGNEQPSLTESETESPLDSMFIEIRKPGLGSPLTETVYKEKALAGLFNTCVIAPVDPGKEDNSTACYEDDAYNDRLTFSFTFRFLASTVEYEFEHNPPSLRVIGDSLDIAEPSFLTKSIDKESSTGEVSIAYGCKSTSSGTVALELNLHFGDGDANSTTIRWKKVCMNQKNDKIELGYLLNENNSKVTRQPFPSAESPLVVTPNDVSTEVFIKLAQAGAQQEFLAPYIVSSNPDITPVTVRGNHPSGGVLQGLEQTTLQVNYDCSTKGDTEISLSIGVPPFENLTASWTKDCGGRRATSLHVGTSEEFHDVVDSGNPTPRYMVAIENIGTAHSDEYLHLPGNQSDWTIYVTNSNEDETKPAASEAALHLGRITLTVEHPNTVAALSPKVKSRGMTGWRDETWAAHIVRPGESLQVSFHFLCRAIGESRVLITIPVLQYDTLEFGIAKECTHIGTARKSRELIWTVGNVFWAGVLAFMAVVFMWWWRRRRVSAKGFEGLPVTER